MRTVRVSWRLLRDPSVPVWPKLIPLAAVGYVILPVDLIPDLAPLVGQADDVAVVLLALRLFIRCCPTEAVRRYDDSPSSLAVRYKVRDANEQTGPDH